VRWLSIAAVVLVARGANADAPHGRYWLNVLDRPYPPLTVNDRPAPPCGDRTKPVLAKLHSFKVVYSRAQAPGKQPVDEVLVDNEPWTFDGFTDGARFAMARSTPSQSQVSLWFGRDPKGTIEGFVHVMVMDGPNVVCADARRLSGSYSSLLRPPHGLRP
jgi:hypothetical protein